jgi:DNA-directed RNA polymerase subunit M/transcription elongation factor TFIIS
MDKSKRFCVNCGKVTTWKRKKREEHSLCSVCGHNYARKRRDKVVRKNHRRSKLKKQKVERAIDLYDGDER